MSWLGIGRENDELKHKLEAAEARLADELRLANQQHEESIVTTSDLLKQLEAAEAALKLATDALKEIEGNVNGTTTWQSTRHQLLHVYHLTAEALKEV